MIGNIKHGFKCDIINIFVNEKIGKPIYNNHYFMEEIDEVEIGEIHPADFFLTVEKTKKINKLLC